MRERRRQERDVPQWLIVTIFSFFGVAVALLGVWLFINLSRPKEVAVPNLAGQSQAEARRSLEAMKLRMRVMPNRVESLRVEADHVVDTDPEVGDKVREGGVVNVRLSAGSRYAIVPDLKGMTLDQARTALTALNLSLEDPVGEDYDQNADAGTILRQDPASGAKVERTQRIRVVVNFGAPPVLAKEPDAAEETGPPPDPTDARRFTIKVRITGLAEPVDVRIEAEPQDGAAEVIYSGRHENGDRFEASALGYGRSMKFRIYYDGELVKEVTQGADRGDR
jgi:serine/threonine-protein kinase